MGWGIALPLEARVKFSRSDGAKNGLTSDLNDQLTVTTGISAISANGRAQNFEVICRLDSKVEIEYYRHSGILQYMLRQFLAH